MSTPQKSSRPGSLDLLRVAALVAVLIGAVGSVGLMIWVGHRNPSRLLLALFLIWDVSPFFGLVIAAMVSKRWSAITRASLYGVMLIVTIGSLALYGDVVLRPRPQPAARFLVVPLGSWLLMTIVVAIAALISGRSRRDTGA